MQNQSAVENPERLITVGELNRRTKELIERNLPLMWIAGEISNFMRAASGHCYFSLKDAQAQVRCVMFRHKMQLHDWKPQNGMQVEVRAAPGFYEPRGEFQLNVEVMRRAGTGALYEAYERLKARLQAEGLFDAALKRPLPVFPRAIGVVTSLQAAALRDVLTTLRRRMPGLPVIVYPAAVQGDGAAQKIADAIAVAGARAECDTLIVCRGGGSIEDLWSFNEEVVARAIRACPLPVISGVGHETDFTIADFVADARAPTPTAAAQLASPDRNELRQGVGHLWQRMSRTTARLVERRMQQLDLYAQRLTHPGERIAGRLQELGQLARRLRRASASMSDNWQWQLREYLQRVRAARPDLIGLATRQRNLTRQLVAAMSHRLDARVADVRNFDAQLGQLNPHAVLERGYSIVETVGGGVVRDSSQLATGESLQATFARGWARVEVRDKG